MREQAVVIYDHHVAKTLATAAVAAGIGALLFGLAVLVYVIWLLVASVGASPFDADGVSCYHRGPELACIKTANP